jgi:hypothetical protein
MTLMVILNEIFIFLVKNSWIGVLNLHVASDTTYPSKSFVTLATVSCHSWCLLVAGFTPRRPGLNPKSGIVGFMVVKVEME